jgi:serine/threonine protein kinase
LRSYRPGASRSPALLLLVVHCSPLRLQRGDLKIFDFGMARVLDPRDANDDGTYSKLSHMTGSLRYMAPEVAMGRPYHASCDVYSLSLVVWEMLSLQRPYRSALCKDEATFQHKVFEGRTRPVLPSRWPATIRELLAGGWAHDLQDRIDVSTLTAGLLSELTRPRSGHDVPLAVQQHQHQPQNGQARHDDHRFRRRSTYVYCAPQIPSSDDPTMVLD